MARVVTPILCDRQIGPLALGLDAEVAANLFERDLQRPPPDKQLDDTRRSHGRVGREEGLGGQSALGVNDEHPANRFTS